MRFSQISAPYKAWAINASTRYLGFKEYDLRDFTSCLLVVAFLFAWFILRLYGERSGWILLVLSCGGFWRVCLRYNIILEPWQVPRLGRNWFKCPMDPKRHLLSALAKSGRKVRGQQVCESCDPTAKQLQDILGSIDSEKWPSVPHPSVVPPDDPDSERPLAEMAMVEDSAPSPEVSGIPAQASPWRSLPAKPVKFELPAYRRITNDR